MKTRHAATLIALCVVLAACSRSDSVFALSPMFKARTAAPESSVAECIASRWKSGTRELSRDTKDGSTRLRAETFFTGVTIGVRLRTVSGTTLVEYFERRIADPLYASMVRGCLKPD
ncbi:hypothetical protein AWB79_01122 [Caballeronia hypogeia]|uniref:Lipoprotein n=1 Tax=Caballeronia hypogeia TaxID=1777140 RepID=A0A157ZNC7_9BURK|nr:hypothetical protein [Caballeronia hypogeia]SAK46467.1 hypothetical protein AWB79_01122 [Caballeronia hypogeia]